MGAGSGHGSMSSQPLPAATACELLRQDPTHWSTSKDVNQRVAPCCTVLHLKEVSFLTLPRLFLSIFLRETYWPIEPIESIGVLSFLYIPLLHVMYLPLPPPRLPARLEAAAAQLHDAVPGQGSHQNHRSPRFPRRPAAFLRCGLDYEH